MITKFFETRSGLRACGWIAVCALSSLSLPAQTPAVRIRTEINSSAMTPLKTTLQPQARTELEAGRVPSNERLSGMSIIFNRSAAQQAALEKLIALQQDPSSPQYHQWLNPEQFAARFGMAQSDIDKVQTWLQQQGFAIDSVARSRNMIRFSGTAGQVELAFQTEMHYYKANGQTHFAPSTMLSVPTAIAGTVASVGNMSNFRPRPMHVRARSGFTSGISGSVFFAPGDIATTYDIGPLYTAGIDGTGQSIAIVGQSAINASDIEAFESAAGLAKKDPVMVMVPGSGTSTVFSGGDEGESDLDVEWAGGMAPGATINFVYVGNNSAMSAFDSLAYAIDEKIATIISTSYGACEPAVQGSSTETLLESALQQAASQGQTVVAASGDQGSTACQGDTQNGLTSAQQLGLAVNYPASSQYVTAVGGTEISSADGIDPTTGNKGANYGTYWNSNGSNDVVSSAKTYIPEVAWNDDVLAGSVSPQNGGGLSASGGGASALFTKPTWQTGVPGIPTDGHRDVPDVSLYSSPDLPGYLFCTSDTSDWVTTAAPAQAASCSSGFRDGVSGGNYLTLAGGTSFAAPIFAGMVALINQKQQWTEGQGLANTTLYQLAANSATYSSAFHDVTSGNNYCTAGTANGYCSSTGATEGFKAGTGYDQVTGLGSVDLATLATKWPTNASPLLATTTTLSAATTAPNASTNDVVTITVAEASGSGTPTGTVNLSIDGGGTANYNNAGSTTSVTLTSNGTVTYTANFSTAGVHTIVAQYAGDATHAASTGSIVITVGGTSSGKGTFAVSFNPSTLTVKQGSSGTESVTVTPSGGYTGTVDLSYVTSNDTALANLCVFASTGLNSDGSIVVGNAAAQGQITVDTNAVDCVGTTVGVVKGRGLKLIPHTKGLMSQNNSPKKNSPIPAGIAFAGLLLAGFLGRSSRKLRNVACVIALASLGLMLSACGGTSGNTVSDPAKGTYTITFTGTDSANGSLTATSTFTLTID